MSGIILVYCVATAIAIVTQRFRVPYTAVLFTVGVALGGCTSSRVLRRLGVAGQPSASLSS